jgi:hypothetical protein
VDGQNSSTSYHLALTIVSNTGYVTNPDANDSQSRSAMQASRHEHVIDLAWSVNSAVDWESWKMGIVETQTDILTNRLWMLEFDRRKPALRTAMRAFPDTDRPANR